MCARVRVKDLLKADAIVVASAFGGIGIGIGIGIDSLPDW